MNSSNKKNPDDARLSSLLHESRISPAPPPRFQENVWRRIADAESRPGASPTWIEALIAKMLRPRLAFAAVAVLVIAGATLGAHDGTQLARRDAQTRYLAAVAPNSLR